MKNILFVLLSFIISHSLAQEHLTYQKPSREILDLVEVKRAPSIRFDNNHETMVLLYRDAYPGIEVLSKQEMRLGGLRIDPVTNIGSRVTYYNNMEIKYLNEKDGAIKTVSGLPGYPLLANFTWSPDQKKMAFTHTTSEGVQLWVLDIPLAKARKLTEATINANMGDVINWFEDSESMLVKMISSQREPLFDPDQVVPTGPTISVADGKKAQNRTYQDLLKNKNDEHNFEQLATSEIHKIALNGNSKMWLGSAMYSGITFSPDGNYIMVSTVEKPFSYLVPFYRFPSNTTIYSKVAELVETVLKVPLIEDLPKGFMAVREGRRDFEWRNDKSASLVFAQALDGGDPQKQSEFRDELFQLEYPYNGSPKSLL